MPSVPLASWNDGPAKRAILDFVVRVTRPGSADFVERADRVAVFDNDGTLWCEYPQQVQVFFLFARLANLIALQPELKDREPYRTYLARDVAGIVKLGKKGVLEMFAATHAGISPDEFFAWAKQWFSTARHPTLNRLFKQNAYEPQAELLHHLVANGFKCFIVSGGGIDLIRTVSEEIYGIPRDQVIGSSTKLKFEENGGKLDLIKLGDLQSFDDREEKVVNIGLHIGRRPILVFGNSDGDLAMMRYAKGGALPSLALLLHHDDPEREFAYDRDFKLSPLSEALDGAGRYGIHIVSMKRDWNMVFATAAPGNRGGVAGARS